MRKLILHQRGGIEKQVKIWAEHPQTFSGYQVIRHDIIKYTVLFCSALAAGDITQIYKNLDIRWGQNSMAIDKISTIKQNIKEPTGKWITWIKQLCRNSPVCLLATVQLCLNHLSPNQLFIRAINIFQRKLLTHFSGRSVTFLCLFCQK